MPVDELSDSYVLDLLKKEAADKSLRYSSLGLTAFQSQKRSSGAPKPNTRFLRNIVRDVDQHNTALLAKEAQEAQERLRRLRDKSSALDKDNGCERHGSQERVRKRVKYREDTDDRPRRQSLERYSSKRRDDDSAKSRGTGRDDNDKEGNKRHGHERHRKREPTTDKRHQRKRSASDSFESSRSHSQSPVRREHDDKHSHRSHRSRRRQRLRSRSRSPTSDEVLSRNRRHSDKRSNRRRPHSSDTDEKQIPSKPSIRESSRKVTTVSDNNNLTSQLSSALRQRRQPSKPITRRSGSPPAVSNQSESSDDVGPYLPSASRPIHTASPAPRVRGRGAVNGESAMNARFKPSYDPTIDVQPEEDADDWDMALEAMRDRQRWKQQGAERLRSAGFDDSFIEAWETNTTKDESKIKWVKDLSAREWDRGKVVDDETGEVNLKAAWA